MSARIFVVGRLWPQPSVVTAALDEMRRPNGRTFTVVHTTPPAGAAAVAAGWCAERRLTTEPHPVDGSAYVTNTAILSSRPALVLAFIYETLEKSTRDDEAWYCAHQAATWTDSTRKPCPIPVRRWHFHTEPSTLAAAIRVRPGSVMCAAGCGWPVDPAAVGGGYDRHPMCEQVAR